MGTSEPAEIVQIVQNRVLPPKRQHRNLETKRKLVEATLVPGASVAVLGTAHVFDAPWGKRMRHMDAGPDRGT